jgi:hypothetical protein
VDKKPTQRTSSRNSYSGDRGAGAAEAVIAVAFLMLLILLVAQFAIWEHVSAIAQATAQEALAAARVQGASAADGQQRAAQVLAQIGSPVLTGTKVTVFRTATTVTVEVTGTAERVLPLPGLNFTVIETAAGPVERFIPFPEADQIIARCPPSALPSQPP